MLAVQQYRAWSDCMDVQAVLTIFVAKTNYFQFQQDKDWYTYNVKMDSSTINIEQVNYMNLVELR